MFTDQRSTLKSEIKNQEAIVKKSKPDSRVIEKLEDKYTKLQDGR